MSWSKAPRKPDPGYIVKKGIGNTWIIMNYCLFHLVGGEDAKPEVHMDNIYNKSEADNIALRLNIEWWDEVSRIYEELEQMEGN
jgi:hypothetical protein